MLLILIVWFNGPANRAKLLEGRNTVHQLNQAVVRSVNQMYQHGSIGALQCTQHYRVTAVKCSTRADCRQD